MSGIITRRNVLKGAAAAGAAGLDRQAGDRASAMADTGR